MSDFMKIRPVGAKLLLADGRTGGRSETNSSFSQFCESAKNQFSIEVQFSFWDILLTLRLLMSCVYIYIYIYIYIWSTYS